MNSTAAPETRGTGLYGSSPGKNIATAAAAELLGTFLLVLAIGATASAGAEGLSPVGPAYGAVGIALVNGLTLAALAVALGHVSGAHLNPAVTLALAVTRRFPWAAAAPYLVAQFAGAVLASLVTWAMYGDAGRASAHLGATAPGDGVSPLTVLLTEAVATMLLVVVVIAATTDERAPAATAPLAVGFALTAAVFISFPLTGAGVNPARALGPMLVSGTLQDWWAYLAGPVIGAVVGALVYDRLIGRAAAPR
ncbi:MIP/aquaporin family protein [Klenkia sp. PcliD-1-E]|uniref:MIP/aquaporin family protein n=1 Tax=Klenkia sp. PcliD-1-E TaxID=2954492 RepID=UPI0020975697|nr:MIP/aquaporin family protein [Klenkia sp. PcliD-1-E]MCO7221830.1 aquaporin family protein [Klenkia sp. PcliD-1-E]